ncbi:MAG: hypothetical protein O3C40_22715 [Planctomycetota bacterium]|nr:hypothetical protein [Planctomycetota bacterium]
MNKSVKGTRNLLILSWLGLGCQAAGVLLVIAGAANLQFGSPLGGPLFLIFGMALGGWASNLSEIIDLKQRVSVLEGRSAPISADQQ